MLDVRFFKAAQDDFKEMAVTGECAVGIQAGVNLGTL